ncbi:uncharacterized protein [Miscanthus floridulus]|uniref:uncharacterized protein n=2 Tax=Miscanthus floridulus TaxID=154761 RepID=UPI003459ABB9
MAREIHGPEFDPSTADLEGDIVMRLGPGKPHGRYYMGNSTIDTANTQTLAQIRARSTSSSPAIRPRSQPQVVALQAQIEALQESQQASQSQFQALQLSHQAELAQERARVQAQLEAFQQSQKAWYEYMASFSQSMGQPPPPPPPPMIPLVPPPPRDGTPGPSTAGSNNDQDLDLSPFLGRAPTM